MAGATGAGARRAAGPGPAPTDGAGRAAAPAAARRLVDHSGGRSCRQRPGHRRRGLGVGGHGRCEPQRRLVVRPDGRDVRGDQPGGRGRREVVRQRLQGGRRGPRGRQGSPEVTVRHDADGGAAAAATVRTGGSVAHSPRGRTTARRARAPWSSCRRSRWTGGGAATPSGHALPARTARSPTTSTIVCRVRVVEVEDLGQRPVQVPGDVPDLLEEGLGRVRHDSPGRLTGELDLEAVLAGRAGAPRRAACPRC